MKLTKKDKLSIQRLLNAGKMLSNAVRNLQLDGENAKLCKGACGTWDRAYDNVKEVIRKFQLPPF